MSDIVYYNDKTADASLTASTEAVSYEKEKAIDKTDQNVWRTTSVAAQTLLFDFGSATLVKAIAYYATNIVPGDTLLKIEAGTTTGTTNELLDLTKATKGYGILNGTTGWNYRYFKLTFTKASGTFGEFGKIALLADIHNTNDCYNWNYIRSKKSFFSVVKGIYGQIFKTLLYSIKIFNLTFNYTDEAQATAIDSELRNQEYLHYYSETDDEIYYMVADVSDMVYNYKTPTTEEYYSVNIALEEAK